jgi:uncharacterized protein YprB with RNaseH-like and TPR domain
MPDFAKALRQLRPHPRAEPPQRHLFQRDNPAVSLSMQLDYWKIRHPVSTRSSAMQEFEALPEGCEEVTPYGRHFVVRSVYDDQHCHGKVRLARFSCEELRQLMALMHEKGTVPDRDSIVFLDTETTGMQGAGMVPFLVGLGYFKGGDFHMVQYFMRCKNCLNGST